MPIPFNPPLTPEELASQCEDLEILRAVKAGGQGATFRATRKADGQPVALKVYGNTTEPERVEREISNLQGIDCPHVMRILRRRDLKPRGIPVIAAEAEWIEGPDLLSIYQQSQGHPPMTEPEVRRLLAEGAKGIETLFDRKVVHRDINPNNVMRRQDGSFVLIDFGYAKHLGMQALTSTGITFGTPGFISPELFRASHEPSFRSDLFSLGVVAYLMASGSHPFSNDQNRCDKFDYQPIPILSDGLNKILARLMRPNPVTRAKTCDEIREWVQGA